MENQIHCQKRQRAKAKQGKSENFREKRRVKEQEKILSFFHSLLIINESMLLLMM